MERGHRSDAHITNVMLSKIGWKHQPNYNDQLGKHEICARQWALADLDLAWKSWENTNQQPPAYYNFHVELADEALIQMPICQIGKNREADLIKYQSMLDKFGLETQDAMIAAQSMLAWADQENYDCEFDSVKINKKSR